MPPVIDLLLLDINGVLYDYAPERRIAALADSLGLPPAAVQEAIFDSGLEAAADAGELGPDAYLAEAGRRLGAPVDRSTWARSLAAGITPDAEVIALARAAARQVRCATLSNNGLLVQQVRDEVYPELLAAGVEVHVAAEYGETKPDRDVYLDVCAALGAEPARTAFVDDKQENADGAGRAGLRAYHFRSRDGLAAFLAGLGLDLAAAPG